MNNLESLQSLSKRIDRVLERLVLRRADQVLCVTEELAEDFQRLYPFTLKKKPLVIPNGYDQEEFDHVVQGTTRDHRFTITYSGDFYGERNPLPFLIAISELIQGKKMAAEDISIRFVGSCEAGNGRLLREEIDKLGLGNIVEVTGRLPRGQALRYIVDSDVLLIIQVETELQIPVKFYEYLASGKPILALTDEGATKNIVLRTGSGIVVDPGNIPGIKESIQYLYEEWKKKEAMTSAQSRWKIYERKSLTGEFAKLLDQSLCELLRSP